MKSTLISVMIIFVSASLGQEVSYLIWQFFPVSSQTSIFFANMVSIALALWLYVRILLVDNVTYSGPTTVLDQDHDLPIPHLQDTPIECPKPAKSGFVKKWDKISEETRAKMSAAQKASYAKRKLAEKKKSSQVPKKSPSRKR